MSTLNGGKLSGNHYYRITVAEPMSDELQPYTAECADIIEALGMTFNEGEAFKAIWRLAASRQGNGKPGNKAEYDADKVAHYGARVAAQVKRNAELEALRAQMARPEPAPGSFVEAPNTLWWTARGFK